jgi:hypothetical protein
VELAETKVVPAGEQLSKTCEEKKKKLLAPHTRTRLCLFCDGVKYYYSLSVVVYFMVERGITISCCSQGAVWACTRRSEEK